MVWIEWIAKDLQLCCILAVDLFLDGYYALLQLLDPEPRVPC